jgi:serine/threonine-protein kinase
MSHQGVGPDDESAQRPAPAADGPTSCAATELDLPAGCAGRQDETTEFGAAPPTLRAREDSTALQPAGAPGATGGQVPEATVVVEGPPTGHVGQSLVFAISTPEGTGESPTQPQFDGEPVSARARLAVPGYELLGVLGKGGMGVVYKARHLALNRVVALKMILGGAHAGAHQLERFRTEAEAVARLQHPNVVQIYEVGEHDGLPFCALEYLDGGNLAEKIDGKPQPPRQAAEVVRTLALALHAVHRQGVVHRDLKPANVMLTADGTPKVTDFGLAKTLDGGAGPTVTGRILGTPAYMAPEQAGGYGGLVGPATDVYALGAVLYEMLTGRPPLQGESAWDTVQQVTAQEPVSPRRLQPKVPPDLETVCLKCLEKDPRKRYPSAGALADDLRAFLEGRPVKARPVSAWGRARKWARRKPAEALLALVVVLALFGLAAGLVHHADQQRRLREEAQAREGLARQAQRDAEARRLQAEEQERQVRASRDEARGQRDEARRQQKLAQDNLLQAQLAVDELINVAQRRLPNEPHMERLRAQLLQTALGFCQRFLRDKQGEGAAVRLQTARAYRMVGDIQELLGKHEEAETAYQSAARAYEGLMREPGAPPEYRDEAAGTYNNLWVVQADLGQAADARRSLARARELLDGLVKELPANSDYQRDLAMTYNNEGIQAQTARDYPAAEKSYQHALELFGHLPPQALARPSYQLQLAKAEKNLGVLYHQTGRPAEAEERYRKALDRLRRLTAGAPDVVAYRNELGQVAANLGLVLVEARKPEAAAKVYDEAVALYGRLAAQFPEVSDYRQLLALTYVNRSDLRRQRGDAAGARQDLEKARSLLERLRADFPRRAAYDLELARALNRLGALLAGEEPEKARQAWEFALAVWAGKAAEGDTVGAAEERRAALSSLIAWHDKQVRRLGAERNWQGAVEHLRRLVALRKGLLELPRPPTSAAGPPAVRGLPQAATAAGGASTEDLRRELTATRRALAQLLARLGQHEEARRALADTP